MNRPTDLIDDLRNIDENLDMKARVKVRRWILHLESRLSMAEEKLRLCFIENENLIKLNLEADERLSRAEELISKITGYAMVYEHEGRIPRSITEEVIIYCQQSQKDEL